MAIFIAFLLGIIVSAVVIILGIIEGVREYYNEPKPTLKEIWHKITHFNP